MSSELFRKLNAMTARSPAIKVESQSHTIVREHIEPVDPRLYALDASTLYDMGLSGGSFDIEKTLFIDTETTGLSGGAGTVAFIVGVGFIKQGRLTVRQYLIPDYSCEAEMLNALSALFTGYDTVVHFNGARFDIPLLHERFIMKRIGGEWKEFNQLDLLKPARRVWKLRLGCCKLKYIETEILGAPRGEDVGGADIPALYFESVRSGKPEMLEGILNHNRQDILTLAKLLPVLHDLYAQPEGAEEQLDIFSLARTFETLGRRQLAGKLYHMASLPRPVHCASDLRKEKYAGEANIRLYALYRRAREYDKCESVLMNMLKRRQMGVIPRVELAKLYEHRLKRLEDALKQADILLRQEPNNAEFHKRRVRLLQKINQSEE